ncbi:MAG: transposase [Marinagarivorans sp.]|nr:transposase [Marinagarivorans sp.]
MLSEKAISEKAPSEVEEVVIWGTQVKVSSLAFDSEAMEIRQPDHISDLFHNKKRGELAWPPLMMFKALLLQSWYGLSDSQLEKQLARDLLFRRFAGLSLADNVPDHSTLWRFRNTLDKENLREKLLIEINDQLGEKGLYIKSGEISIVDASVIQAQRNRPNKGVNGNNTQDPEAGYSVKVAADGKLKTTYGFKAHVNVDEDGFIKATDFTAGNVQRITARLHFGSLLNSYLIFNSIVFK